MEFFNFWSWECVLPMSPMSRLTRPLFCFLTYNKLHCSAVPANSDPLWQSRSCCGQRFPRRKTFPQDVSILHVVVEGCRVSSSERLPQYQGLFLNKSKIKNSRLLRKNNARSYPDLICSGVEIGIKIKIDTHCYRLDSLVSFLVCLFGFLFL